MSNFLIVPVKLDALRLQTPTNAVEAMADFSELPYNDGARDRNPDTPYLSESILPDAFNNLNLVLSAGIHLHWALPDALTVQDQGEYQAVPNRWLVTREYFPVESDEPVVDKWVVESDYLYPDGEGESDGACTVPIDPSSDAPRPFRYMGRAVPLDLWSESLGTDNGDEFAMPLTAAGYGEPAFAAFYPNCSSVFGFYDSAFSSDDVFALGLTYYVVGWYADATADPVAAATQNFADAETLRATLEDQFEWTFDTTTSAVTSGPLECLCMGRLTFKSSEDVQRNTSVEVCVGSTPTEALAAYLAKTIAAAEYQSSNDARRTMEDQLEALTLEDSVLDRDVDTGASFQQVRHEKEFTAVNAGSLWDVKVVTSASAGASANSAATASTLPDQLITHLNELNQLQWQYNNAQDELEGRRRLLFADWYKYMLCAYPTSDFHEDYPDIDEVRRFILECDVKPISTLKHATGTIAITKDENDDWVTAVSAGDDDATSSLAAQIVAAFNTVMTDVASLNEANSPDGAAFGVREIPAARYWQANDPVLLLVGDTIVKASDRYGQDSDAIDDDYLDCQIVAFDSSAADAAALLTPDYIELCKQFQPSFGLREWSTQPWNPILLEWQVEFFPLANGSSVANGHEDYSTSCVQDNYQLAINDCDLTGLSSNPEVMAGSSVYEGTAILTDHASSSLQDKITEYLVAQIGTQYGVTADDLAVNATVDAVTQSYIDDGTSADDPVCTSLLALQILTTDGFYSMSQALGGFTDALNMQKQTLQLAIKDPLGFAAFQEFADLIGDIVDDSIDRAPQPLLDFNPLRAGCMEVLNLRIVDSFGQYADVAWSSVTCAEKLTCTWDNGKVYLPPRIAEPARFGFNWVSADDNEIEQRATFPAATPVCGWLLTNHLENSIMVYDAAGTALGSIVASSADGFWEEAPGATVPISDPLSSNNGISNSRLRDVVERIMRPMTTDDAYLASFIAAVDSACDSIEPESTSQHQALSLLMGRPLAVVRAAVSLQTQGLPEYDQDWTQFRFDMVSGERETHGFEQILFPVRIGEDSQLNDGLVGYWVEADGSVTESTNYYSLQSDSASSAGNDIVTRSSADADDDLFNIPMRFDAGTTALTMLLDPRGSIHATCGALPARTITLPSPHYSDVLKKLEVTFLTAPILTGRNQVCMPLAEEPGYTWSWLSLSSDNAWSEISSQGVMQKSVLQAEFADQAGLWQDLLDAAWLTTITDDKASIVARDKRSATLDGYDDVTTTAVSRFLDRYVIAGVSTAPVFSENQILREGWLKLTPQV